MISNYIDARSFSIDYQMQYFTESDHMFCTVCIICGPVS